MGQIFAIAQTTLGEAIRRRVLLIILLIGLAFLIISPSLNQLTPRGQTEVLVKMTLGILKITSAILAVTLTVYLIPNEVERRTIYTILSKPVQRYQFLVGKFLGSVGALAVMIGLMTLVLLVTFSLQQRDASMDDVARIVKSAVMYVFQMSLLAGIAMLFSTIVTPIVNFFMTGMVFVFGTLMNPIFESLGASSGGGLAGLGSRVAHYALPNFTNVDITGGATQAEQAVGGSEAVYMMNGIIYAIIYTSIMLVLAVLIFDRREI
ncbi:MAG: ABC transporter permease [Armatimonadetes bacterium]|nr:ABC transporter permease [Armatimonadota bacterium]